MLCPKLLVVKEASHAYAVVGDIITYKVTLENQGNITLSDIIITDLLSANLIFINDSFKINSIPHKGENVLTGVNIGDLDPDDIKVLTFDAKVVSKNLNIESVVTYTTAKFNYRGLDCNKQYTDMVNTDAFRILICDPRLSIEADCDCENVFINDIVDCSIKLNCDGCIDVFDVLLKNNLSGLTEVVEGSFIINGVLVNNVDLNKGLNIGTITCGETICIKYKLKILSSDCANNILGTIDATFSYMFPDCITKQSFISSNPININVALSSFKQVSIDEYLTIPCPKPNIETINSVNADVDIIKSHVVNTVKGKSREGQNLSGFKLIAHGIINFTIEYTACDELQSVHSAHFSVPFSEFIILPVNYKPVCKIEVDANVEYVNSSVIDCRHTFNNILILLVAKILK
jgi:uncharacterized repeat protein (TIGR01451 family)